MAANSIAVMCPRCGDLEFDPPECERREDLRAAYRDRFGEDLFRPRDERDVDVDPESVRGRALDLMDRLAEHEHIIETHLASLPWYHRLPLRLVIGAIRLKVRLW